MVSWLHCCGPEAGQKHYGREHMMDRKQRKKERERGREEPGPRHTPSKSSLPPSSSNQSLLIL
jgi:hypothetical protein